MIMPHSNSQVRWGFFRTCCNWRMCSSKQYQPVRASRRASDFSGSKLIQIRSVIALADLSCTAVSKYWKQCGNRRQKKWKNMSQPTLIQCFHKWLVLVPSWVRREKLFCIFVAELPTARRGQLQERISEATRAMDVMCMCCNRRSPDRIIYERSKVDWKNIVCWSFPKHKKIHTFGIVLYSFSRLKEPSKTYNANLSSEDKSEGCRVNSNMSAA